jgi:hypothetical protein
MAEPDLAVVPMLAYENGPAEDLEGHRWMFMERGH